MAPLHQGLGRSLWLFLHFSSFVLSSLVVSFMGRLWLCCSLPCLQQVFHYYAPALELIQLVNLADLPGFLVSRSECELYPLKCGFGGVCVCIYVCLCVCGGGCHLLCCSLTGKKKSVWEVGESKTFTGPAKVAAWKGNSSYLYYNSWANLS